jgi:hypothetical protein
MELYTGDMAVPAYTTRARAFILQLDATHSVAFDLTNPEWAQATVGTLWSAGIAAAQDANVSTANAQLYIVRR